MHGPLVHLGPSLSDVNESLQVLVPQSHKKEGFKGARGEIKVGLLWALSGSACQSCLQESCPGGVTNGGREQECGLRA